MREMAVKCPHCGAKGKKILGVCKFCLNEVCSSCGNAQVLQGKEVIVHNKCFLENIDRLFSVFKFLKIKQS